MQNQLADALQPFLNLLSRAKSFRHLIFYNRRLVDAYELAAYGFKMHKSRDGHEQAKCTTCGVSFQLDPIVEEEKMLPKEGLASALANHQEFCEYYGGKGKSKLRLEYRSVGEFGVQLCERLYEENRQRGQQVEGLLIEIEVGSSSGRKGQDYSKLLHELQQYYTSNRNSIVLAIFGWKLTPNLQLQCQYCSATVKTLNQPIDPIQSHRASCPLSRLKYWQPILHKLYIKKLQSIQGQFLRTEGQVRAKQLQQELQTMSAKTIQMLGEFRYKVKGLKSELVGIPEYEQRVFEGALGRLGNIEHFAEELEQSIRSGIKKIKVQ